MSPPVIIFCELRSDWVSDFLNYCAAGIIEDLLLISFWIFLKISVFLSLLS